VREVIEIVTTRDELSLSAQLGRHFNAVSRPCPAAVFGPAVAELNPGRDGRTQAQKDGPDGGIGLRGDNNGS
jgi:hypothetical protein